ncbi:hypothetical protein NB231_16228 [Nitrococcus mobilis Nb-231]|uniref:Uncharacterized protein n=1 Tax=Nitrococcus mobilis Nb-231 TaxID=314278 RepID=A4BM46_9GAMM|nr:hypothetical protein NB231_16228 [Nitrococcus mobilis Nb-231]
MNPRDDELITQLADLQEFLRRSDVSVITPE